MSYNLLENINSPQDLKALKKEEIPKLCREIRDFLIENVERQGGHLASNLGVTELTVAMHRVFDCPRDHFIFDVGHQSYVHKILTGRRERFSDLRAVGGLSGFTVRKESEYDAFGAGHSSTSVSAALGFTESDNLNGSDAYTVVVLGDGAYTGGMVHEALNNVNPDSRLIIILNENGMSISVNKGRFSSYLSRVRISRGYQKWKSGATTALDKLSFVGRGIKSCLTYFKRKFKSMFLSQTYFEDLGLYYIGKIDGNDYEKIENALAAAKSLGKSVLVHVKTTKGKGYLPAESAPDNYHSVAKGAGVERFNSVFTDTLIKLAKNDEKIIAVTAAMGIGTGLEKFAAEYPKRYFDVGIAEAHALTFAAGLAAAGKKPYVAIYSTFLQRGYDNVIHDIALQNLPVRIIVDRAGLSLGDGATHHGIFDVAFLSQIPNVSLYAPVSFASLRRLLVLSQDVSSPIAIRYANSGENERIASAFFKDGCCDLAAARLDFEKGTYPRVLFLTYGNVAYEVLKAEEKLKEDGFSVGTVLIEKLKPCFDALNVLRPYAEAAERIVFVEEGIKSGGAGMIIKNALSETGLDIRKFEILAIDDNFASYDKKTNPYDELSISCEKLIWKIKNDI